LKCRQRKTKIVKECDEAAVLAIPRRASRGEAENSFELYSIYTAIKKSGFILDICLNLLFEQDFKHRDKLKIYLEVK